MISKILPPPLSVGFQQPNCPALYKVGMVKELIYIYQWSIMACPEKGCRLSSDQNSRTAGLS